MSDNEQIKKLDIREHIRLRPSMYIGSVDNAGMHYLIIGFMRLLCEQSDSRIELVLDLSSDEVTAIKFKGTVINQLINSDVERTLEILTGYEPNLIDSDNSYLIAVLFHLASYMKVSTNKNDIIVLDKEKFNFSPTNIERGEWLNFYFKLDGKFFGDNTFSKAILSKECEKIAALNHCVQIELFDSRNGCDYHESFTMKGGLIQLFKNKLDRLNSRNYDSYRNNSTCPNFQIIIKEPELSLEMIFNSSNREDTFEDSYYRFINLNNGGSHVSYFKLRLAQLNEKLNLEIDSYNDDLKFYNLMTNVETKFPFPFAGPTKTRIEDPILVQIMKTAFDKLEPEVISFYSTENNSSSN